MNFDELVKIAEEKASGLEPWDGYYRLRAKEMEALFSIYAPKSRGSILDIGAGMAFNAVMLNEIYENVVAVDLPNEDTMTHTVGMEKARRFLALMSRRKIELASCSGESLPFASGSFDAVFCIYTLEHIKNRKATLKEVRRVLKPEGAAVIVVPGFLERFFYPLSFYRDLLNSALSRLIRANKPELPITNYQLPITKTSFFKRYPHFPFPEPHGEYPNFSVELSRSTPFEWVGLAKRSGLKIRSIFTTMLFPKELSSLLIGKKALGAYIKAMRMNRIFGGKPLLKYCGQNLCFVLEKNG